MSRLPRCAVSTLLALSLTASQISPGLAGQTPITTPSRPEPLSRADYEACQASDEASFRAAVEVISVKALEGGIKEIDYAATVAVEWRRQGLDEILDQRVDLAIAEVRAETSWSGLAKSLVSKEKAQQLATQVAERVYNSDAVKTAIEGLAAGVGREVGERIESASLEATGPVLDCLRAFLGPRYGSTVAGVVIGDAERDFRLDAAKGGADVSSGAVLRQSGEGIAGAAILLVRRQLANMAARIGQRLAGSVLARLVSVVAGGIGLVLIAKDIWDLRDGVLPIIAEEMKSKATKESVRAELAKSISEQIGEHVREIGAKSAERIVDIWQGFRRAHAKVLELSESHAGFRTFLDKVKPEALARLDEVTALVLDAEGEAGVLRRLDDGSFDEAVRFLPEPAMQIARETRSIDTALGWSDLAGDRLRTVLDYEIYRRAGPGDFTKASLARLLDLDDRLAVTRLAGIGRAARETLSELGPEQLRSLARSLTESELETLASYLVGLAEGPRDRVLEAVAGEPANMQLLSSASVRDAVIASRDQSAAVSMMLREDDAASLAILADLDAAWEGRIAPVLILHKHPGATAAALILLVALLLMLRRLLFARRVRPA